MKRTITQNKALHLWFNELAEAFNDAGLDARTVLKPEVEIPWTQSMVKNLLWRPLQIAMFDKVSTKDLKTDEINKIYEPLNRHLGEKFGKHTPFPSLEEIMLRDLL
jgi:hypothetical protein